MICDSKIREDLRQLTMKVEGYFHSNEGKVGFGDLLKLIQNRDLGNNGSRSIRITAGWVPKRDRSLDDQAA